MASDAQLGLFPVLRDNVRRYGTTQDTGIRSDGGRKKQRNRVILSCTECHRRKQKCSRTLPCRDCIERKVPYKCHYLRQEAEPYRARTRNAISRSVDVREFSSESINALSDDQISSEVRLQQIDPLLILDFDGLEKHESDLEEKGEFPAASSRDLSPLRDTSLQLGSFDVFSVLPETVLQGPAPNLIFYFIERLAPWLGGTSNRDSNRRLSFLPHAVHHAALFHALLLCAAVHLCKAQPGFSPSIPVLYKAETLRHINSCIGVPSEATRDEVVATAFILLYFNVGGGDPTEYVTHLKGINQIVLLRGGLKVLATSAMLKGFFSVCHGPWNEDWEDGHFEFKVSPKIRR